MTYVFISYSHDDVEYVRKLSKELEKYGFDVWFDESIETGEPWFPRIVDAIKQCSAMVVIMTPEAQKSSWVEKEIQIALTNNKPIFPLLLKGKVFDILINIHYHKLNASNNCLPELKFFRELANKAPKRVSEKHLERIEKQRKARQEIPPDATLYAEVAKWSKYGREGSNHYYGILRYAIALEAEGSTDDALLQLKRAYSLEPRIVSKAWLSSEYEWSDSHDKLLQQLLDSPEFQNYKQNKR